MDLLTKTMNVNNSFQFKLTLHVTYKALLTTDLAFRHAQRVSKHCPRDAFVTGGRG